MANPRFLLRLVTVFTVYLLTLACFGIVLWVVDEILGWDILPDALSLLVRAALVAGGIIAAVLVVMNVVLSLSLIAEASASRAELPDFQFSRQWRRRFRFSLIAAVTAIVLVVTGLQITDRVRANVAEQAAQVRFTDAQSELDAALPEVLALFTDPLRTAIAQDALTDQSRLAELRRLFSSIQTSFPKRPQTVLLVKEAAPYRYKSIDAGAIAANAEGQLYLAPEYYSTFPSVLETKTIEALFNGELNPIEEPLEGSILRNTVPSTWGVLKQNDQVVAVVYLQPEEVQLPVNRNFHHSGPETLISFLFDGHLGRPE